MLFRSEEANNGDYCWMYCSDVSFGISYILDVNTPYDKNDSVFTDKSELMDAVTDFMADAVPDGTSEEELDEMIAAEVAKYNPHWKKVIAIYATN